MILDLFLVMFDLMLELIHGRVHGYHQIFRFGVSHEVVFMLRVDDDFHFFLNPGQIDRHFDHQNPLEKVEEFFGLRGNLGLMLLTQVPMAGRNFNLHDVTSSLPNRLCDTCNHNYT